jgi:probable HAF family extracellular repeat protein
MPRFIFTRSCVRRVFASLLLGAGLAALAPLPARADTGTLTPLGTLGGTFSNAYGVSSDGSVVVGQSDTGSENDAFRWTQAGGMVDLGTLGGTFSYASSVSADGGVVVGYSDTGSELDAFRWTQAGGMVDLGTLGGTFSRAYGVSADGSVVVGQAHTGSQYDAFRWTQAGGMVDLGTLGGTSSNARGVSADGSVVVGWADNGSQTDAFRWTQAGGMVDLGTLGGTSSDAYGVSADGNVVVGISDTGSRASHAFRWTQAGGMADLGVLPGDTNSYAYAVSATGKVVVGTGDNDAFRWTQATGMQDLNTLLSSAGVNMTGIQLTQANGVSSNGQYIVGQGNFSGTSEAFLATYIDATVNGSGDVIAGMTTAAAQQTATQNLSADQRATLIEGRSTANALLGMTRPVDASSFTYGGAMFGSALAYTGGQYAERGVTVLGGIAYGRQDYPNVRQGDAPTVAAAARYTFDDPFGDEGGALHPYGELGGWITPRADCTLSRTYANGSGFATGQGMTNATAWAEYGRAGLAWDASADDQLTGYGELGQQYMSFDPYSEAQTSGNPFPASVGGGLLRFGVARGGLSWTHRLDDLLDVPVSFTLAGAAARSFDVHSGMTANVSGVGTSTANNEADTWGEFGARVETGLTDGLALDLDLSGTTGGGALGTVLHGGVGVVLKF